MISARSANAPHRVRVSAKGNGSGIWPNPSSPAMTEPKTAARSCAAKPRSSTARGLELTKAKPALVQQVQHCKGPGM